MTLITYDGPRGRTYGYRFWYRGRLFQRMVGRTKTLAKEAEKRERQRVEKLAWEARWGPFEPGLTKWETAITEYLQAKDGRVTLDRELYRLRW